jgi:hypothetical protein
MPRTGMEYEIISRAFIALVEGKLEVAKRIVKIEYHYNILKLNNRNYNEHQSTKLFVRDGFIDRYSGKRLIFPPILRIFSILMPEIFPFQKNWKMSDCHIAYWQLFPTVDHIIPVTRGGEDIENNCVTTSMLKNSAKSNWLLEELGWELYPQGELKDWDGLIHLFMEYSEKHPDILKVPYIYRWHKAAIKTIAI